jgi:hypothetical protein
MKRDDAAGSQILKDPRRRLLHCLRRGFAMPYFRDGAVQILSRVFAAIHGLSPE